MATNYIIHLNSTFSRFADDKKVTPFHISLYMALFHKWNKAKFRNPVSVSRDELMQFSKIGSANTYSKCLKELHHWGYIQYEPSHNYHIGSKVYMLTFNTSADTSTDKTSKTTGGKTTDTSSVQELRPYINSIKQLKHKNKLNNENEYVPTRRKNNSKSFEVDSEQATKKKQVAPAQREIKNFFAEQNSSELEAEKFFNHYQSNGWLVGKVKMKNWQASAKKWILNADKFKFPSPLERDGRERLRVANNKNYAEPL